MSESERLSQCMLENNDADRSSRRGLRQKALTISVILECAILSALVLWPLFDPALLPKGLNITPTPRYHGMEVVELVHASGPRGPSVPNNKPAIRLLDHQPPRIPSHVSIQPTADAPNISKGNSDANGGEGPDSGSVPMFPGTDGTAPLPEIKRPAERTVRQQISEGVMEASLVHKVLPTYPAIARPMHLSGQVILHAIIGTDGGVRQLQIASGNTILGQSALAAVREWRYQPTRLSGQPVEVETTITVNFILEQN